METEVVDPELRGALRWFRLPDLSRGPSRWLLRKVMGALPSPKVDGVSVREVDEDGARVRVVAPDGGGNGGGLLWVHGGGLVVGSAKQDDRLCAETALELGLTVVSVDHRLAPEDPFPAALDDCAAAWTWFQANAADLGVDPARIVVGGESAGGGLAACLAQRVHDAGGVQPAGQWLFAPMLDDRTAARTELDEVGHFIWNNRNNRYGWGAYLGREPGAAEVPPYAAAARREDLSGLPPTWLYAGDIELFHEEIVEYGTRLREAGVATDIVVVEGAYHAFETVAPTSELAGKLFADARAWLGAVLTAGAPAADRESMVT
ncbi:MAG: alpha/beta hydrolase [Actinomycetota bacterium]|nr:alpha/beta hydrolase [Actinomycetota bacterium]